MNLILEGPCIIFAIHIQSNEIHNVVCCTSRTSWTYRAVRFLPRTIVCTYSIYKEAPEDGPLRSKTCRAET